MTSIIITIGDKNHRWGNSMVLTSLANFETAGAELKSGEKIIRQPVHEDVYVAGGTIDIINAPVKHLLWTDSVDV